MSIIVVSPVPNNEAHKAKAYCDRVGIRSKITKDGITTFEMIIPNDMSDDHTKAIDIAKKALKYDANNWQFEHTTFKVV